MAADEITNFPADEAGELTGAESVPGEPTQPAAEPTPKQGWSRRAFFQAAALGAAAAAFLDGKHFVPSIAWADDLSNFPCTAGDINVLDARATNDCTPCTGTFDAVVDFDVENTTGTTRYCVSIHIPAGFPVPAQTVVLGDISPGLHTVQGTITGFPCSPTAPVCLGPGVNGTVERGKCDPGTCLTISFGTSSNSPCPDSSPPKGQCRHQTICIAGFGASLVCSTGCDATCGTRTATLKAAVDGGTPNYKYDLFYGADDGSPDQSFGPSSATSHTFTGVTVTQTTTYTLKVTDSRGCSRTATTSLTVKPKPTVAAPTYVQGCAAAGTTNTKTFTATASGCTGTATFNWSVDGTVDTTQTGSTFKYPNNPDSTSHSVSVTVTCDGCTSDAASTTIIQCINSSSS